LTAAAESTVDTPRIEFLHPLTPRQAVLLHYVWGLAADALNGDTLLFASRLRWLDAYAGEMRAVADGQRQINLITARISGIAGQLTPAERELLGIRVVDDPTAEVKCTRCGCTEARACMGGCYWWSTNPPICSRCA
jgi:hypothetical protein